MMGPRRMVEWLFLRDRTMDLLHRQALTICELRWLRDQDRLTYARNVRDLITHFRSALEEDDQEAVREALDAALIDLRDEVARGEEHLV